MVPISVEALAPASRLTPPSRVPVDLDALPDKLRSIRREIRAQYLEEDGARPWIIGFSGGKDSI